MQTKGVVVKYCAAVYALFALTYLLARQRDETGYTSATKRQVTESEPQSTSETSQQEINDDTSDVRDKTWRRTNHIITQYRPDLEARLTSLAERKAPATDPEVIQLARDVIDPVPATAAKGIKRSRELVRTPQAAAVMKILNGTKRDGFFVECGALDGERSSNTVWLEQKLGWTGLLVEMDPFFYTQALGKNRRAHTANACLSPYTYISALPYRGYSDGQGRLLYSRGDSEKKPRQNRTSQSPILVPCFPFESLMAALNQTRVDYFSLDIEGAELDVLKTIPWDRLDIRILSVEYSHGSSGKEGLASFMTSKGYTIFADIHMSTPIYVFDYIFVKTETQS